MTTSGYTASKDGRGVEQERQKRAAEAAERTRKQHVATDLAAKKNFLFSTNTTINMKSAVMKTREMKIRELEDASRTFGMKEHSLTQEMTRLKTEADQVKKQKEQKDRDLLATKNEHDSLKREIDQLARDKAKLETEVHALEMQAR
jgi:chromosome segregation ATPase